MNGAMIELCIHTKLEQKPQSKKTSLNSPNALAMATFSKIATSGIMLSMMMFVYQRITPRLMHQMVTRCITKVQDNKHDSHGTDSVDNGKLLPSARYGGIVP